MFLKRKNRMKNFKNSNIYKYIFSNNKAITIFSFLSIIIVSILFGIINNAIIEYNPINGDFQTYNMVRRLLDGQVPFRDFFIYLGFGPLYLGSIFTIFNNSFSFNLIVVDAISTCIFASSLMLLGYMVSNNLRKSAIISATVVVLTYTIRYGFIKFFYTNIETNILIEEFWRCINTITHLASHGNSLKPWRGFIAIIISILMLLFWGSKKGRFHTFLIKRNFYVISTIFGTVGSAIIVWSNDIGVSSYIAISFCYFVYMLTNKKFKQVVLGTLTYIGATLIGLFILINIFTLGNFNEWLRFTLSVSSYQSWYYFFTKSLTFSKLYLDYFISTCIIIVIYNLVKIAKIKDIKKLGMNYSIMFLFLAYILGHYIYCIGTCNNYLPNFLYHLLDLASIVIILYYLLRVVEKLLKRIFKKTNVNTLINIITYIVLIVSLIALSFATKNALSDVTQTPIDGDIDGVILTHKEALEKIDTIVGNDSYFSTYATAFETMKSDFQPTRFDYIIHVLGDDYRQEYLDDFSSGNYKYVSTINPDFEKWAGWVQNANWFFYRHLYAKYVPTYKIGYNILWVKSTQKTTIDNDVIVTIIQDDEDSVTIQLESNLTGNYIADVSITYKGQLDRPALLMGVHHSMVNVELSGQSKYYLRKKHFRIYNLPKENVNLNIPIYIEDGYGSAVLTYTPKGYGTLTLESAVVKNLFKDTVQDIEQQLDGYNDTHKATYSNDKKEWYE